MADSFLVRALRENIDPPQRLGITLLADANTGKADQSALPLMKRITADFQQAGLITIRFGADPDHGDEGLLGWLKDERIPRD